MAPQRQRLQPRLAVWEEGLTKKYVRTKLGKVERGPDLRLA